MIKTIIIVLLLIFVYPIGVVAMWLWSKWNTWVKFFLSLPLILFVIALGASVVLTATSTTGGLRNDYPLRSSVAGAIDARKQADLYKIRDVLEQYFADEGKYPKSLSVLVPNYIDVLPTDAETQKDYMYSTSADRKSFVLKVILKNGSDYTVTSPD